MELICVDDKERICA